MGYVRYLWAARTIDENRRGPQVQVSTGMTPYATSFPPRFRRFHWSRDGWPPLPSSPAAPAPCACAPTGAVWTAQWEVVGAAQPPWPPRPLHAHPHGPHGDTLGPLRGWASTLPFQWAANTIRQFDRRCLTKRASTPAIRRWLCDAGAFIIGNLDNHLFFLFPRGVPGQLKFGQGIDICIVIHESPNAQFLTYSSHGRKKTHGIPFWANFGWLTGLYIWVGERDMGLFENGVPQFRLVFGSPFFWTRPNYIIALTIAYIPMISHS